MIIQEIETTDLFSYSDLHLPLQDIGLVLVEGPNGVGKSTIFRSLTWVLFGDTLSAQKADDVIRQKLPDHKPIVGRTQGIVRLQVDNDSIEVHRHRRHSQYGNKILLFVDGKEVTKATDRDSQAWINRRLQLDAASFKSCVMMPQGTKGFASLTDSGQKEILERVLDLSRFSLAQQRVKSKLSTLRPKLTQSDTYLDSLKGQLTTAENDLESLDKRIEHWDSDDLEKGLVLLDNFCRVQSEEPKKNPQLATRLAELQSRMEKQRELEAARDQIISEHQQANSKLQDLQRNLQGWEQHRDNLSAPDTEPDKPEFSAEEYRQEVAGLNTDLARLDGQTDGLHADADKAREEAQRAGEDKTCWTCGQQWPTEKLAEIRKEAEQRAKIVEDLLRNHHETIRQTTAIRESTQKLAEQAALWEAWKNARKAVDAISLYEKTISDQKAMVAEIETNLQRARDLLSEGLEAAEEFRALSEQRSREERSWGVWEANLGSARAAALRWTEGENPYTPQIGALKDRVSSLQHEIEKESESRSLLTREIQYNELWERGFGNAGVKSLILDTVTPFLNERANEYLQVLSGGDAEVEFTTQKRTKAGELREKFDVRVSYRYGSDSYSGVSGGEGHRVDVAAMFALGDLAASRARAPVRLRLLDEPFDNLDALGQERVFELLRDQISPRVGTLLVMSHDDRLASRFEKRITVVKENGVSRIEI